MILNFPQYGTHNVILLIYLYGSKYTVAAREIFILQTQEKSSYQNSIITTLQLSILIKVGGA